MEWNGTVYDGKWRDSERNCMLPDSKVFKGEWRDGTLSGKGPACGGSVYARPSGAGRGLCKFFEQGNC